MLLTDTKMTPPGTSTGVTGGFLYKLGVVSDTGSGARGEPDTQENGCRLLFAIPCPEHHLLPDESMHAMKCWNF